MRTSIVAWLAGFILVTGLYLGGPAFSFNRATPPILGLPPIYFWFVLIPIVSPLILGAVYLIDRAAGGIGADVRGEGE